MPHLATAQRRAAIRELTDTDRLLLAIVSLRPLRVWPRDVLWRELQVGDRAMRQSLERLRQAGSAVVPSPEGGYFLATDPDQVEEFRLSMSARLQSIGRTVGVLRGIEREMRLQQGEGKRQPVRVALL